VIAHLDVVEAGDDPTAAAAIDADRPHDPS
jgi:hypothetical protein